MFLGVRRRDVRQRAATGRGWNKLHGFRLQYYRSLSIGNITGFKRRARRSGLSRATLCPLFRFTSLGAIARRVRPYESDPYLRDIYRAPDRLRFVGQGAGASAVHQPVLGCGRPLTTRKTTPKELYACPPAIIPPLLPRFGGITPSSAGGELPSP